MVAIIMVNIKNIIEEIINKVKNLHMNEIIK